AVGDVLMNPLPQSQFVPLAEALCCTVSEMNANHVKATQETLTEQLVKSYPGIAVPSHETVYHTLGTLIKDRKIYHTGEGYFMVTPRTYFISHNATEATKRGPLQDSCCSSPSITYLVTIERCADLTKENIPTLSRYRSCRCFPDRNMLHEQRHQQFRRSELHGGGKKGCKELKPSIQDEMVSACGETRSWDTIKLLVSAKEKLKCKRFGFDLFWRKKSRKEYSTFSAQFPPKEWPVRDEDDLDNIPRDIEHEIIKRINPMLTVENLTKHTVRMQRLEEQKTCFSKGTSAEPLALGQNHLAKEPAQKAQSKAAGHGRKSKPNKEKPVSRSKRKSQIQAVTSPSEKPEEHLSLHDANPKLFDTAADSQGMYKKQIKNPFQGLLWRHDLNVKGNKGQTKSQPKRRARKQQRRSLDSSKIFGCEAEQLVAEKQADKAKPNKSLHVNRSSLQLSKDSLSEEVSYLQGSTFQTDDKCKYFMESRISEGSICRQTAPKKPVAAQKSPRRYTEDDVVCKGDAKYSLNAKDEHSKYKAHSACKLLDQTSNTFQNVSLSNYTTSANLLHENGAKYRQKADKRKEFVSESDCRNWSGSVKLGGEGLAHDCHLVHQKAHDGNTCASLCVGDNFERGEAGHLHPGCAFSGAKGCRRAVQKAQKTPMCVENVMVNVHPAQHCPAVNQCDSREHEYEECSSLAEPRDGPKAHEETGITKSCPCSPVLPTRHTREEETGLRARVKASAVTDFCKAPGTGALQSCSCEMGEELECSALGLQAKERRNSVVKIGLCLNSACAVIAGQNHSEGTENYSITGDSGIDSPR
ncbi:STOX1 protein, partial [Nothoprocta pentlandii]|nr:STOX1 protein [Nothoprocta pentlandii]